MRRASRTWLRTWLRSWSRSWRAGAFGLLGALVASAGCGGAGNGGGAGPFALTATTDTIHVSPGDETPVRFILTKGGVPVAGQTVTFAI